MQRVALGTTGEQVSELCLGTMTFSSVVDQAAADEIVGMALDAGLDFLDTAAMYGDGASEEVLGEVLKGRRDEVFLATKVHAGLDRGTIEQSLSDSLRRLQTDRVDLFLLHWPAHGMDVTDSMAGLNAVVEKGMARHVGVCNYPAWLLAHANRIARENGWAEIVSHQVGYNLIERGVEVEVLAQGRAEGLAVTTYRPLCMGLLAGKYLPGRPLPEGSRAADSRVITWVSELGDAIERFVAYCEARDWHPATAALSWVRHSSAVTAPIIGVSSVRQLESSLEAANHTLTAEEYDDITAIFHDTRVQEEGLQRFPGVPYNYPQLRRAIDLISRPGT